MFILGVYISLWLPRLVLNQRQVFIVVSDWEPYLGSHVLWVFCGRLFPVSVFVPHGTVSGFHISCFVVVFMFEFSY